MRGQAPPAMTCSTSATLRGTFVMLRAPLGVTTTLSSSRTPPKPWPPVACAWTASKHSWHPFGRAHHIPHCTAQQRC